MGIASHNAVGGSGSPGGRAAERGAVLLGNFEVEDEWAAGEPGLPRVTMAGSKAIVNRMDEFTLLLAGPDDHVVLKSTPDPDYLGYLTELGLRLPTVLVPARSEPARTVTGDALADEGLLARLRELAGVGGRLWPHGVSDAEELLAERTGLPLAAPAASVCKRVNSKVYSRALADELGLRQPAGAPCRDLDELARACEAACRWLDRGQPVVLKDAFGVSGKGILVVRDRRALDQVRRMVERRAARSGRPEVGLVLEQWVPKELDLNYQFTVGRDGEVRFDFVKEALTDAGVHKGHRMPARIATGRHAELVEVAGRLGARLFADGYFGVVGVDAMLDPDGALYPVVEINARNNMSTYQERLRERFFPADRVAVATHYPVRLHAPLGFDRLRRVLDGVLFDPTAGTGLLVNNFATVNAAAGTGHDTFEGRLYGIVVADGDDLADDLDRAVRERLSEEIDDEP